MAGDDDEMFMTRSLNVTPKTTEHRSDKFVAYVTNNKRLRSTFCTHRLNGLLSIAASDAGLKKLSKMIKHRTR